METLYRGGGAGASLSPPNVAAAPQGQVPTQLEALHGNLSTLRGQIIAIEERLSSVLGGGASVAEGKPQPAPVLVPLAEGIRAAVDEVRALQLRCEALLNAIQL